MDIVAGTRNRAKIAEMQRLVADSARIVAPPPELQDFDPDEHGQSFEENAVAKALAWSQRLHRAGMASLVIASDGGLWILSLAGWNPLLTRRFAGPSATDLERAERLLDMGAALKGIERMIFWEEAVAIANQGAIVGVWSAASEDGFLATTVDRELIDCQPGFWIPAIWLVPRKGMRPLATLSVAERRHVSGHWRQLRTPVRRALVTISQIPRSTPGQNLAERSKNHGSSTR